MTPTARTLAHCRRLGLPACVVEKWMQPDRDKPGWYRDAFGFGDVLVADWRENRILLVQCTSADHVSHRLHKIGTIAESRTWLKAGGGIEVWGWKRVGRHWHVRRVSVTLEKLEGIEIQQFPRRGRKSKQPELFR